MGKKKRYRPKRPVSSCALCGQIKKLCKSHIVPKTFIRELRAHGERTFWYDLGTTRRPIPMQDGWKEYLLCGSCEQRIGRWEKVVCEDLRGHGRASATRKAIPYDGPIASEPVNDIETPLFMI